MNPELLKDIINLIDVMASRGAVKGAELISVGSIRNACEELLKNPPKPQPVSAPVPADVVRQDPKTEDETHKKMRLKDAKNKLPGE
jgi:hypothetical protein